MAIAAALVFTGGCSTMEIHRADQIDADSALAGLVRTSDIELSADIPEASDLAFDDENTLWTVSDRTAMVYPLSTTGQSSAKPFKLDARDVEGVAFDSRSKNLFVVDEATSKIVEVDRKGAVRGDFTVDVQGGYTGIEGIAYDPETDGFVLVHERNPTEVIFVDRHGTVTSRATVATEDLSAVTIDRRSGHILVVGRFEEAVIELDRKGKRLNRLPVNIPGVEGIALDDAGRLYLVTDRGSRAPSTLYVFAKGSGT